jgi:hypothetical protein
MRLIVPFAAGDYFKLGSELTASNFLQPLLPFLLAFLYCPSIILSLLVLNVVLILNNRPGTFQALIGKGR